MLGNLLLTLQAGLSLQYLKKLSDRRGTQAMIFSGDLNSPPDHPAYQFIKEGKLTKDIKQSIMDQTDFEKLDNVSEQGVVWAVEFCLLRSKRSHFLTYSATDRGFLGGERQP